MPVSPSVWGNPGEFKDWAQSMLMRAPIEVRATPRSEAASLIQKITQDAVKLDSCVRDYEALLRGQKVAHQQELLLARRETKEVSLELLAAKEEVKRLHLENEELQKKERESFGKEEVERLQKQVEELKKRETTAVAAKKSLTSEVKSLRSELNDCRATNAELEQSVADHIDETRKLREAEASLMENLETSSQDYERKIMRMEDMVSSMAETLEGVRRTQIDRLGERDQRIASQEKALERLMRDLDAERIAADEERAKVEVLSSREYLRDKISDWIGSQGFKYSLRYWFGHYVAKGFALCREDVFRAFPNLDLNQWRFDPLERFLSNGRSLALPPLVRSHVVLADESLPERPAPEFRPRYASDDVCEDEVLPPQM